MKSGQAVRIMTGAPIPPGADSIVPVERVRIQDELVYFDRSAGKHAHIRRVGSEIRKGQLVLKRGSVIGPAEMALLAFFDRPKVKVYRRPRVALLSTGDELGPVGKKRPFGHIPDSNRYGLIGLVESAGCEPVDGGRVGDRPEELLAALKQAARKADFILTTGGVSAGDFDVVKVLFWKLGGVKLYRLRMKPGKPQAFGQIAGIPFFGLPGNPVSCMVVFDFLVRPALRKMAGASDIEMHGWRAKLAEDFPKKTRDWEFPRAIATEKDGRWTVRPVTSQRSSNLKSMVDADGYLVLPPDLGSPKRGASAVFIPLPS
jgi:molybdopterin molybdotransferase